MKRMLGLVFTVLLLFSLDARATNLLQVYHDALCNDPIYHQALAQQFSNEQGVPISFASLLPTIAGSFAPAQIHTAASGSGTTVGPSNSQGYTFNLSLNQAVFDYGAYENVLVNAEVAKQARATMNAALQDLMIRVSKAYLAVLEDEDNLRSAGSTKDAYAKQLDQVNEEYKVGIKTITDVYTARASYESSSASYITAETKLANDKENLRAITGIFYTHLDTLSDRFPLVSPSPANIDAWVCTAQRQNWSVKAAAYAKTAAVRNIKVQCAGHLPSVYFQENYSNVFADTQGDPASIFDPTGRSRIATTTTSLNVNIPIFQGGGVIAKTKKAKFDYLVACQGLEKTLRDIINQARQSYLDVIAGINKVKADQSAITSNQSSLEGMEASYSVGTTTLVDVLNQRQNLFIAELRYASDRYAYVNRLLSLKQAAGTLSEYDLGAINYWLIKGPTSYEVLKPCLMKCHCAHARVIKPIHTPCKRVAMHTPKHHVVALKKAHHFSIKTVAHHVTHKKILAAHHRAHSVKVISLASR